MTKHQTHCLYIPSTGDMKAVFAGLQTECVQLAVRAFEDMPVLASRTRDFLNSHCSDSMAQLLSDNGESLTLSECLQGALELVDRLSVNLGAINRWTRTEDRMRRHLGEKVCEWQRWCDNTVQQIVKFFITRGEIRVDNFRARQILDATGFRDAREISEMVLCATLEFIVIFSQLNKLSI